MDGTEWREVRRPGLWRPADGALLVPHLELALSPQARMRGLLGRAGLEEEAGLFFVPCNNIHMFFMRFAIDVVFLSRDWRVLKICRDLRPWRIAWCWAAGGAVELPAGRALRAGLREGDRVRVAETPAGRELAP